VIHHKRPRLTLLIILMSFNLGSLYAQLEANVWPMADSGVINWQGGKYPKSSKSLGMLAMEGTGAICDSSGNLLLYSNGQDLFSGTGKKLNTDFKLRANPSTTQGVLILKHPESTMFYIFTNCDYSDTMGLYLTRLEITGDSAVFYEKARRILNTASEGINAVNHQNGRDIWVLTHSGRGDTFFVYLLNKNGLQPCVRKFSLLFNLITPPSNIWISADGRFGGFEGNYAPATATQCVYKFNSQTAYLKDAINLNTDQWGMAFTISGEYFYSFVIDGRIIRRSTKIWVKSDINNSIQYIYNKTDRLIRVPRVGYHNTAVFPQYNKNHFSIVTNCADDDITRVEFIDTGIRFTKAKCTIGNFNTNQSYFYTPALNYKYKQDCNTNEFHFWGVDTFSANAYRWEIKKGNSISKYTTKSMNHQFTDTGIWQVKYVATNGSRMDSVSKEIEIFPILKSGFLGKDIGYCGNAFPITLQGPKGMNCYTWSKPKGTETYIDHINADTAGTYILETCNPVFCTFTDTIKIFEKAEPDTPKIIRKGDSLFVSNAEQGVQYQWYKGNTFTGKTGIGFKLLDTAWYKVRGVAPVNCFGAFDSVKVESLRSMSLLRDQIQMYPNPVSDEIYIRNLPSRTRLSILDVTGRLVYEATSVQTNISISLNQLPAGHYQLVLEAANERMVYTVIKL
jgi:hypothetical protein